MDDIEITAVKLLADSQKKDIWELLLLADKEFIPPLSERESTVQQGLEPTNDSTKKVPRAYFEELVQQEFLLASTNDRVIGFFSYISNHTVKLQAGEKILADYVSTIIVHPDYRRGGIAEKFYERMIDSKDSGNIVTRTWSSNFAHLRLLQKLGFQNVLTVTDDRGTGIDTVYMCKSI